VTDNSIINKAAELRDGNFSCKGTRFLVIEILSSKAKFATIELKRKRLE